MRNEGVTTVKKHTGGEEYEAENQVNGVSDDLLSQLLDHCDGRGSKEFFAQSLTGRHDAEGVLCMFTFPLSARFGSGI